MGRTRARPTSQGDDNDDIQSNRLTSEQLGGAQKGCRRSRPPGATRLAVVNWRLLCIDSLSRANWTSCGPLSDSERVAPIRGSRFADGAQVSRSLAC